MKAFALLMIVFISGCASTPFEDWDRRDTAIEAAYAVLHAVDWAQTREIARSDDYYERNLILGEHPSTTEVDIYMGLTLLGHALVSGLLEPEYRTWWQGLSTAVEAGVVVHNYSIGIRF